MTERQVQGRAGRTLSLSSAVASTIAAERDALAAVHAQLPPNTDIFIALLGSAQGNLIFTGLGKSGHVARLLAATFCSLGISALFLHPTEALHGDIGVARPGDVCIMVSKSGFGVELTAVAKSMRQHGIKTALICCQKGALVKNTDVVICLPIDNEACRYNLVPTNSVVATIAFGHGVALSLASANGFGAHTFGRVHPGGSIGRNLLLTVGECMITASALPLIDGGASFSQLVWTITQGRNGVALVCDEHKKLQGIVTDGDLRRACARGASVFDSTVRELMTPSPKVIGLEVKAKEALAYMHTNRITGLVVTQSDNTVLGFVHMHDLLAAGITPSTKEDV